MAKFTSPTARDAIRTRYHGPSNVRGSRFIATDGKNRITVPYDHNLDSTKNHAVAAGAFLNKHNQFETKLVTNALCFDNDYYWTWEVTGPLKTEAA
jgi:hypothetical protein